MAWRSTDQLAADGGGGRAIEGDCTKLRKIVQQMFDLVVLCEADRLVEAAATPGRGDHVPQPDAPFGEAGKPSLVRYRAQLLADRAAKQSPELVRRVRIILPRDERSVPR